MIALRCWGMRGAVRRLHDGELRGRRRERVERHLSLCRTCQAELARLEALDRQLFEARPRRELLTPEAARGVFDRALLQAGFPRRPGRRLVLACSGIAWTVVGGLAAFGLVRLSITPPRANPSAGVVLGGVWSSARAGISAELAPRSAHPAAAAPAARGTARRVVLTSAAARGGRTRRRMRGSSRRVFLARRTPPAIPDARQRAALGSLIVLVTAGAPTPEQPRLEVDVRYDADPRPGYASASAAEWDSRYGLVWRQYTSTPEEPEGSLVIVTRRSRLEPAPASTPNEPAAPANPGGEPQQEEREEQDDGAEP